MTNFARIAPPEDDRDELAGAETEIQVLFRLKLTGIRQIPRRDRPHAVRAAKLWRTLALKALRERRDRERHARHAQRRERMPEPT